MPAPGHTQRQIDIAREELTAILMDTPSLAPRVARALTALQVIERSLVPDGEDRPAARRQGPKVAKAVEGYRVERSPDGGVLAEFRSTGAEPFRCPKQFVDATAAELQRLRQSKFKGLHEAIEEAVGDRVPDYHIRTALRWMKHEGLIRHEKTRFSAATGASLRRAVAAAWKRLESEN